MVTTDWQHSSFCHHPGAVAISGSSIGHSTRSRTKGYGAHQIQSTTRTALQEHTEGALSKALSVAGFDGSWSETLTAYSDYLGQIRPGSSTCCWSCNLHCHSITSCHFIRTDYVVLNASQPTAPQGLRQFQHRRTTRVPALVTTLARSPIVVTTDTNHQEQFTNLGLHMHNGYTQSQSSERLFNGYHPVRSSLVAWPPVLLSSLV